MNLSRRKFVATASAGVLIGAAAASPVYASIIDQHIEEFTGGADVLSGGIDLDAPEIAENGNTVPVNVTAEGAVSIMLLASANPVPSVATFNFGPLSGARSGSTRIRLIKTQDVLAIAKMEDGTFKSTKATVKVTIGGCGG